MYLVYDAVCARNLTPVFTISVRFRVLSMFADLQVTHKRMDIVITVRASAKRLQLSVLSVRLVFLSVVCLLLSYPSCLTDCLRNPPCPVLPDHLTACFIYLVMVVAFFFACEEFGRMFNHSFPACPPPPPRPLILVVEISSRTTIPLFRPGSVHSGSASCPPVPR